MSQRYAMVRSALILLAVVACGAPVATAERCQGLAGWTDLLWCDDYDNYCSGGSSWPGYPPLPAGCPTDGSAVPSDAAYLAKWTVPTACTSPTPDNHTINSLDTNTGTINDLPFSLQFKGGYDGVVFPNTNLVAARHVFSLMPAVHAKDASKDGVNGSDQSPLKLGARLYHWTNETTGIGINCSSSGGSWCDGDIANAIWYVELTHGGDRAPTDYVKKACNPSSQSTAVYPVICQQYISVPGCPPLSSTTHASIAVGLMALLDPDPCNVETGRKPTNYHLSVFDGLKWIDLKQNRFPGTGDFNVREGGEAILSVEIRSNTFFVSWDVTWDFGPEHSEATIPRQYLGPFDSIGSGPGQGCELRSDIHECKSPATYRCFNYCSGLEPEPQQGGVQKPGWCWRNTFVDSLVLFDGILVSRRGACCLIDGTCVDDKSLAECDSLNGSFRGEATACGADDAVCKGACCHTASCEDGKRITECPSANWRGYETTCAQPCPCVGHFADVDADGDVDQADFSVLQDCFESGAPGGVCVCFDKDSNQVINLDDAAAFEACASGPGVPFNANCDQ